MAARRQTADETYRCPECDGDLTLAAGSWGCVDCGFAPPHDAD